VSAESIVGGNFEGCFGRLLARVASRCNAPHFWEVAAHYLKWIIVFAMGLSFLSFQALNPFIVHA
jgi:hypothetical protein